VVHYHQDQKGQESRKLLLNRAFLGKEVFRAKRCSGDSRTKFKPFKYPCSCCFALVDIFSVNLRFQGELSAMPAITNALKGQQIQRPNYQQKPGCIFLTLPTCHPSRNTHAPHRKHKQGPSYGGPRHKPEPSTLSWGEGASALPWCGTGTETQSLPFPERNFQRGAEHSSPRFQNHLCRKSELSSDIQHREKDGASGTFL